MWQQQPGDEDEDDEGEEEADEDQVDWWSRFFETLKDEQRVNEELKKLAKKNKNKGRKKSYKTTKSDAKFGNGPYR